MTIHVNNTIDRSEIYPLYYRYRTQSEPQDVFLELTENGVVSLRINREIGNAVPNYVYHHRTLRFDISPYLSGRQCIDLLEDPQVMSLLRIIHAGHEIVMDSQSNYAGKLTDIAKKASEDLEVLLAEIEGEAQVADAGDYVADLGGSVLETILRKSGDITAAARRIEEAAVADGIYIDGNVEDCISDLIQDDYTLLESETGDPMTDYYTQDEIRAEILGCLTSPEGEGTTVMPDGHRAYAARF